MWVRRLPMQVAVTVASVVFVGTPGLFVRELISVTAPTLPCPVACDPAAATVKPGFTGASPPDAGPPIRVVASLMNRPRNDVLLALAPSLFVFSSWDSFFSNSGGTNPLPPPLTTSASSCVTLPHP